MALPRSGACLVLICVLLLFVSLRPIDLLEIFSVSCAGACSDGVFRLCFDSGRAARSFWPLVVRLNLAVRAGDETGATGPDSPVGLGSMRRELGRKLAAASTRSDLVTMTAE